MKQSKSHGAARGLDSTVGSTLFEGRFGRMFRTLPRAEWSDKSLRDLADAMTAAPDDADPDQHDAEESHIPAGYTYFGQFIDHDLTFDPASQLQKQNDPASLVDYRTPRFDLDCIYGRGPDDQPYLFEPDGRFFSLGGRFTGAPDPLTRDLVRSSHGRAIIGDKRNDENVIVSQLQGMFLRLHNYFAAHVEGDFAEVQRQVRYHYQWVVLHDFLPRIIGRHMLHEILPHLKSHHGNIVETPPQFRFFRPEHENFIPIEFTAAAYRLGHSMIRPRYRLNATIGKLPIFLPDPTQNSLSGFHPFPSSWAIDWRLFFQFDDNNPVGGDGEDRIQPAYKIDTSLVDPLRNLPEFFGSPAPLPSLAYRNLRRGMDLGLPSGQDVARYMGVQPLEEAQILIGKATEEDNGDARQIQAISPEFEGKTPLWAYILAEARHHFKDDRSHIILGPVGGRIVGEVFAGLLYGDKYSQLRQDPLWKPDASVLRNGRFDMPALLSLAQQAPDVS